MSIHNWTRLTAGVFHHFHHAWISSIADVLNESLLPNAYYGLLENQAEEASREIATVRRRITLEAEQALYAAKANRIAVFHATGDRVVAYIEIVSPGNKQSKAACCKFLDKLADAIQRGFHLLVIDPHPLTPRDPNGLHARF